jgi:hypothetical protein
MHVTKFVIFEYSQWVALRIWDKTGDLFLGACRAAIADESAPTESWLWIAYHFVGPAQRRPLRGKPPPADI